jgi:hypothetical protein
MQLSAPKQITWWIAVVLGVLGLVGIFVPTLPILGAYAVWLVVIGFLLLALATLLPNL